MQSKRKCDLPNHHSLVCITLYDEVVSDISNAIDKILHYSGRVKPNEVRHRLCFVLGSSRICYGSKMIGPTARFKSSSPAIGMSFAGPEGLCRHVSRAPFNWLVGGRDKEVEELQLEADQTDESGTPGRLVECQSARVPECLVRGCEPCYLLPAVRPQFRAEIKKS